MKITLTPPGGGQPFVLADDAAPRQFPAGVNAALGLGGRIIEGFRPSQTRMDQVTPLIRAAHPFIAARLNVTNALKFTVDRAFNSAIDCIAFLSNHADNAPVFGFITMSHQTATSGLLLLRFLPNCSLRGIDCVEHVGASCKVAYNLFAAAAWQNNPPNP